MMATSRLQSPDGRFEQSRDGVSHDLAFESEIEQFVPSDSPITVTTSILAIAGTGTDFGTDCLSVASSIGFINPTEADRPPSWVFYAGNFSFGLELRGPTCYAATGAGGYAIDGVNGHGFSANVAPNNGGMQWKDLDFVNAAMPCLGSFTVSFATGVTAPTSFLT